MNWRTVALIGGLLVLGALAGCQYEGQFSMEPVTADSTVVDHKYTDREDLDEDQRRFLWDATVGNTTVRASENPFAHEEGPYLIKGSLYDLDVETTNETTTTVVELRLTVEDVVTEPSTDRNTTTTPAPETNRTATPTATERNESATPPPPATATTVDPATETVTATPTATVTTETASNESASASNDTSTSGNGTVTPPTATATATSTETPTETRRTETTATITHRTATTTPATGTVATTEPPSGRAFDDLPAVDRSNLPGERLRAFARELDNGTRIDRLPLSERRVRRGDDISIFLEVEYNASQLSRSALASENRTSQLVIGGRSFDVDVQQRYERTERTYHIDGSVVATDPGDHLIETHREQVLVLDDLSANERQFVEEATHHRVALDSDSNETFEKLRSRFESADPLWPAEYDEEYYLVEYEGEVYQARMVPAVHSGDGYGY
ncbi:MAG: hypothetical protein ABEJ86_05100 [Halococcoides sp.]